MQLPIVAPEQFGIARVIDGAIGPRLPLELLGAELEGDFVLIYQEYYGELSGDIAVRNGILRDVFPEQVNHVNIAITDEVRSLTFSAKDEWLSLRLE